MSLVVRTLSPAGPLDVAVLGDLAWAENAEQLPLLTVERAGSGGPAHEATNRKFSHRVLWNACASTVTMLVDDHIRWAIRHPLFCRGNRQLLAR